MASRAKYGAEIDASHTFTATLGQMDNGVFVAGTQGLDLADLFANPVRVSNNVPEHRSLALLLLSLGAIGWMRRPP